MVLGGGRVLPAVAAALTADAAALPAGSGGGLAGGSCCSLSRTRRYLLLSRCTAVTPAMAERDCSTTLWAAWAAGSTCCWGAGDGVLGMGPVELWTCSGAVRLVLLARALSGCCRRRAVTDHGQVAAVVGMCMLPAVAVAGAAAGFSTASVFVSARSAWIV